MIRLRLNPFAAALLPLTVPGLALAGPTGGEIVTGVESITSDQGTTTVVQNQANAIVNWDSFSVGSQEAVVFSQNAASWAILNRVVGGSASEILGRIDAPGRVFIVNPNGLIFGAGASINVGSLVASTLGLTDGDFLDGDGVYHFSGLSNSSVSNAGELIAAEGGFVVLQGATVSNSGLVQAQLGEVLLGSGSAVTLQLNGEGPIAYAIDSAALDAAAGVTNLGTLAASGGLVVMTAQVAHSLISTVVNNQGLISAAGIEQDGGQIRLVARGGDLSQTGMLDVSASAASASGTLVLDSDNGIAVSGDLRGASVTVAAGGDVSINGEGALLVDGDVSGRNVSISANSDVQVRGDVRASMDGEQGAWISAAYGGIEVGEVEGAYISLYAGDGSIVAGDIDAASGADFTSRDLTASDDLPDGAGGYGGRVNGIDLGEVTVSDGSVVVLAESGGGGGRGTVVDGISAAQSIWLRDQNGSLRLGDVAAGGTAVDSASILIEADSGSVTTGALGATARNGAMITLDSAGELRVDGPIELSSTGYPASPSGFSTQDGISGSWLRLESDGDVSVTGEIHVAAAADAPASPETAQGGRDAGVYIRSAGRVMLEGDLNSVEAAGGARLEVNADRQITIDGNTEVTATPYHYSSTDEYGGQRWTDRYGYAAISLWIYPDSELNQDGIESPTQIRTGDLFAQGPEAFIDASAGRLTLGDGELATEAVRALAYASDDPNGAFYQYETAVYDDGGSITGWTLSERSTQAAAEIFLEGRLDAGPDNSLLTAGGLSAIGPEARTTLLAGGHIVIGGSIAVTGTGYDSFSLEGSNDGAAAQAFDIGLQGEAHWGDATLSVAGGYFEDGAARDVLVQGDVVVSGVGTAEVAAYAQTLRLAAGQGAGELSIHADAGTLRGTVRSYESVYDPQTASYYDYSADHVIGDGAEGAATYGRAQLGIALGDGGRLELGDVSLSGLSAQADIAGDGAVVVAGDISIAGTTGAEAPIYHEVTTYTAYDASAPQRPQTTTSLLGDSNYLSGLLGGGGSFSSGDITVSGTGLNGVDLSASNIEAGQIVIRNAPGSFSTDDFDTYGSGLPRLADIALLLGSENAAQLGGIDLLTQGTALLALSARAQGDVSIDVGSLSDVIPQTAGVVHPLDVLLGTIAYTPQPAAAEYGGEIPPTLIQAGGDISLSQSADSTLAGLELAADGALGLDGRGTRLSTMEGPLSLSGDSVAIQDIELSADSVAVTTTGADGALSTSDARLAGQTLTLEAGGALNVEAATLEGSTQIRLHGASLSAEGSSFVGPNLSLGSDDALNLALLSWSGSELDLASGGAMNLQGVTLGGDTLAAGAGAGLTVQDSSLSFATASLAGLAGVSLLSGSMLEAATLAIASTDGAVTLTGASVTGPSATVQMTGRSLSLATSDIRAGTLGIDATAGDLSISGSELSSAGTANLTANGAITLSDARLEAASATLGATGALGIADSTLRAGSLAATAGTEALVATSSLHADGATTLTAGSTLELLGSTLTASRFALDSGGATLLQASTVSGDLVSSAGGTLTVTGSTLQGSSGELQAQGDVRVQGLPSQRSRLAYGGALTVASTGGAVSIIDTDIGGAPATPLAKATGGNVTATAAGALLLRNAGIQGNALSFTGGSIALENSGLSGGTIRLIATQDGVDDNAVGASRVDAEGLGVQAASYIDLAATELTIGAGQAGLGGDAEVIQRLAGEGLAPVSAGPNAAFVAPQSIALGNISLGGDHLYLQTDLINMGALSAGDALLQFRPFSDDISIGVERSLADHRDLNLAISDSSDAQLTFVIGGSGFNGPIYVGEDAPVDTLESSNVVLVTTGNVFRPSRLATRGQVVVLDGTIVEPAPPDQPAELETEVGAIQNQIVNTGSPQLDVELVVLDDDLIDEQSSADGALVCQ